MLRPASTRIRVLSVANREAFPELPLASTQNFTIVFSPNLQHTPDRLETESGGNVFAGIGGGSRGGRTHHRDAEDTEKAQRRTKRGVGEHNAAGADWWCGARVGAWGRRARDRLSS